MATKWVYLFSELDAAEAHAGDWEGVRGLLGGKGANLADMTRLGIPVPPGFIITTQACNAYLAAGKRFPPRLWEQVQGALAVIEKATTKKFGDSASPLLVSCRSGAKFSMPGMMDTVLDIGLNDTVAEGLVRLTKNPRFVWDAYRRLVQMFGSVVLQVPDEVFEAVITGRRRQAGAASDAELTADDWKRVIDYRNASGIPHDLGTAVSIVTMVFGNMGSTSATGVAMSRNASTGESEIEGDYLVNAQGEDVVAGIRQTRPIADLATQMPEIYAEFAGIARKLERHYRNMPA